MYLKTALSNIRRSPFQALVIVFALTVTFFVATIISLLIYSSAQVLKYFETRPQIIAFLKTDAKTDAITALENKLKNDSRIKDVKFVTKEDALALYKRATSDNPLLGQLVSPSIFPSSLEFSVKDLTNASKLIQETQKESVVDSVSFTASLGNETNINDVLSRLTKVTFYIRVGGLVLASILGGTSLLVLMAMLSMKVSSKRSDFDTMKLMGATGAFIKTPIIIEALMYVFLGVFIGWTLATTLILYIYPLITSYFASIPILPADNLSFIILNLSILGGQLLVGFIIATIGAYVAVTKAVSK